MGITTPTITATRVVTENPTSVAVKPERMAIDFTNPMNVVWKRYIKNDADAMESKLREIMRLKCCPTNDTIDRQEYIAMYGIITDTIVLPVMNSSSNKMNRSNDMTAAGTEFKLIYCFQSYNIIPAMKNTI